MERTWDVCYLSALIYKLCGRGCPVSYDESHSDDECDCCLEKVGKENLKPLWFLYLDRNDHVHPDCYPDDPQYKDYKCYCVCDACYERELRCQGLVRVGG